MNQNELKREAKYDKYDKARYPVIWSCAWSHCTMPANIDTYAGCSYGCKYCFTKGKGSSFFNYRENVVPMPFNEIKSRITRVTAKGVALPYNDGVFQRYKWAFDNITYKIGVRYDPLPGIETKIKNTLKTIQLFTGKNLAVQTKNPGLLRDEYIHSGAQIIAFISMSTPDNFLEEEAPPYKYKFNEGLRLIKEGVRVSWRITPAIVSRWSDDELKKLFETDAFGIISGGFESTTPKELKWVVEENSSTRYFDFAMKLLDMGKQYNKPVHFVEPWLREFGVTTCLPEGCNYWKGTVFDENPELPDDVKIHPIKRWAKPTPIKEFYEGCKLRHDRKMGKINGKIKQHINRN